MTIITFYVKSKPVKRLKSFRLKAASNSKLSDAKFVYDDNLKNCKALQLYLEFLNDRTVSSVRSPKAISTNISRISKFLSYSYFVEKNELILKSYVMYWIFELFQRKHYVLTDYCKYLSENHMQAPATIYSFLGNIQRLFDWLTIGRKDYYTAYRLSALAHRRFVKLFNILKKNQKRLMDDKQCKKSHSEAVNDRRFPKDGFNELQGYVIKDLPFVQRIIHKHKMNEHMCITPQVYTTYMRILFASIYVFAVNGRVGGIESLLVRDFVSLMTTAACTSEFKTRIAYGKQAIMLGRVARYILKFFFNVLRPLFSTPLMNKPDSPLWIGADGNRIMNIGLMITQYFHTKGLHITTNSIRTLVETTTALGFMNGTITAGQVAAVHSVNGHSSQMAKEHYTLIEAKKIAEVVRGAMDLDRNTPDFVDQELEADQYEEINADYADWGTRHPEYKSESQRIAFSEEENDYLLSFAEECGYKDEDNTWILPPNFASRCLRKIKADPDALPIFHLRHILFVDRLRARLRALGFVK